MCRSWSCVVVVLLVPHILVVIIMGCSIVHPSWVRSSGEWHVCLML